MDAMTSKYDALAAHLDARGTPVVTLTFAEVEAIVGPLPNAAWRSRPWWGVGRGTVYSYAHVFHWRQAGWVAARADLAAGTVTFRRNERGER
jgi:hypothetical protein